MPITSKKNCEKANHEGNLILCGEFPKKKRLSRIFLFCKLCRVEFDADPPIKIRKEKNKDSYIFSFKKHGQTIPKNN